MSKAKELVFVVFGSLLVCVMLIGFSWFATAAYATDPGCTKDGCTVTIGGNCNGGCKGEGCSCKPDAPFCDCKK